MHAYMYIYMQIHEYLCVYGQIIIYSCIHVLTASSIPHASGQHARTQSQHTGISRSTCISVFFYMYICFLLPTYLYHTHIHTYEHRLMYPHTLLTNADSCTRMHYDIRSRTWVISRARWRPSIYIYIHTYTYTNTSMLHKHIAHT
jgi:hypothetical protein